MTEDSSNPDALDRAHAELLEEHSALVRDFYELEKRKPFDAPAHEAYLQKLKAHLEALKAHTHRLKERRKERER